MKIVIPLLLLFLSVVLISCDKENQESRVAGEITISSERKLTANIYEITAYSFEHDKPVIILTGSEDADLVPVNIINNMEVSEGMRFSVSTSNQNGYYLNGTFADPASAENYFNLYMEADAPSLSLQSDTIKVNQVHTFQNSRGNWVKILVKDLRAINPGIVSGYYEADIKFVIQRDGTKNFPE